MEIKKKENKSLFSSIVKKITRFGLTLVAMFPAMALAAAWDSSYYGSGSSYFGPGMDNPYGLPEGTILGIASNFLFWLISLFAILGIVGFVLSGIFYLISAGDEDMVKRGKDGMKWSIIGILVGLSGFLIMKALSAFLSGASKNF